ncbi:MAG: 2-oxoglutarate dehydrogenase E1 component [Saprospiraceae bacterium]|nr:2-oxoglutarate dehydrogenase E1 component [Saprospiraceae bacterium]
MSDYSHVANAHPSYIEAMYKNYQQSPESIEKEWRLFFEGFDFASYPTNGSSAATSSAGDVSKEFGVLSIIHGFRQRGHLLSTTNPIRPRRDRTPHLDLADYGLSNEDLSSVFQAGEEIGMKGATLAQILDRLKVIYCGSLGVEYAHIENRERRMWLRHKLEQRNLNSDYGLSIEKKRRTLEKLNGAVIFERFLHTKYVGQKRFSLEGGETTIAALDAIIHKAAGEDKVEEVVIGMAHRGRLNVLANTLGKTYEQIFTEFEGTSVPDQSFGDGDVKYHLGFSSIVKMENKEVYLKLVPNPSHLEAVNPVLEGFTRAKIDLLYNDYSKILPITIHGDAAAAGQGVVYETVQMSQLPGYKTGGTIHFVINNQIGFTTDFDDARSSTYSTASAALVQAPVFHVNGDDPEAVVFASELATEYRQKFHTDVYIDMVCYRRHGHNEGDDPKFTQPKMYEFIANHPDPREIFVKKLLERGDIDAALAQELEKNFWNMLQERLDMLKEKPLPYTYQEPEMSWKKLSRTNNAAELESFFDTGIPRKEIDKITAHLMTTPKTFTVMSKINRLQKSKKELLENGLLDWGFAELLAFGSIINEGHHVRMSGQDVKRGTFSHRHAVFFDEKTNEPYNRLDGLNDKGKLLIFNSLLSEFAVLGFEYGYSLASPDNLVIWEAQFGDFYNGAQTIVDQFIAAGESKWQRMSGLVMLLPHGMEGQGPEHSSARLERFLMMGADFNIIVANVTTPANYFHLLRRQLALPFRKPVIHMSPKSLLRHPKCVSKISEFESKNGFQMLIEDPMAKKAERLLFCSGKVYYDLEEYREKHNIENTAIVRVEQLFPLPEKKMREIMKKHKGAEVFWVQEESANMGAWNYMLNYFRKDPMEVISRKASASPATGFKKVHDAQQEELMKRAFGVAG